MIESNIPNSRSTKINNYALPCLSLLIGLQEAKQLIRIFPQFPFVKSDVKIPEILRDFVALVENEFDGVADVDIGVWLSDFIDTDTGMTP